MTIEEYQALVWVDLDRAWELIDGRPREKPGKSWDHLDVVSQVTFCLMRRLNRAQHRVFAGGRVLHPEDTVLIPDLLVVPSALGAEWRGRPGTLANFPEPLPLIVEVWSRSSGDYDVMTKLPVYQQRGDREIWMIHPYKRTLTAWLRREDALYDEVVFRGGEVEAAALSGVTIRLDELFDDALSDDQ